MTKYRSDPPPSIGWWSTELGKSCRDYRWWDDEYCYIAIDAHHPANIAAGLAMSRASFQPELIFLGTLPLVWPKGYDK